MLRGVKMFGRVCILRGIAAPDVSADEAFAQMNPAIAHLEALLASLCARLNVLNLVQMSTVFRM